MPKIGNPVPAHETLCERCNSKRKISKTWTEKIKNDSGFMILEHAQIICTNKECQSAFEKTLIEETQKREKLKQDRIIDAIKRLNTKISR